MAADPLTAIGYAAFGIAVTLLTMRRASLGLCTLIAVVPFALYQDVFATTVTLPKVALLGLLLGLTAYRDAFVPIGSAVPWRIASAGLLVLAATMFTFWHATYHESVLRETLKIAEYVVAFCAVVAAYRLDPNRRAVRTVLLGVTIAVALLALGQEVIGAPSAMLLNGRPIPRIAGPLEGPNQLAGFFDVTLPLAFALNVEEPSAAATIALFLALATDVLTFSRGGIIGALIGVAIVAAISMAARRSIAASIASMGGGLAVGLGVALSWGVLAHTIGLERFWDFRQPDYAGGVGTRPQLWRAAWTLWLRHPFFGIGAGNFEREIPLTGLHGIRTHANSLYLQSLVEGGIPLFAAQLWLVYTSIAAFAKPALRSPFVLAALAAGAALALHQIVDFLTFYPKVGDEWWIVMGLGAAELAVAAPVMKPACA